MTSKVNQNLKIYELTSPKDLPADAKNIMYSDFPLSSTHTNMDENTDRPSEVKNRTAPEHLNINRINQDSRDMVNY